MKLESKVTEKVTKEEKVLTISESEFRDIVTDVAKSVLDEHSESGLDPIIRLALTMENANFVAKLHRTLFNDKEK